MTKYSTRDIIVVCLIVVSTVFIETAWKYSLQSSARQQARYNVEQIRTCTTDLLLRGSTGNIEYKTLSNEVISEALQTCARDMKVSPTGDVFAFDLHTKQFVFDPSLDCFVDGGKKMTVESECSLHQDPEMCKEAISELSEGTDSVADDRLSWRFDDSREYLEWVVLPADDIGFNGMRRGLDKVVPHQVVVVQGVQEDELWTRYGMFRGLLYLVAYISILLNLAISYHGRVVNDN